MPGHVPPPIFFCVSSIHHRGLNAYSATQLGHAARKSLARGDVLEATVGQIASLVISVDD